MDQLDILLLLLLRIAALPRATIAFSPISSRAPVLSSLRAVVNDPPEGRVKDIDEWIQWTSDSLQRFDNRTLFEFMNVVTMEEIHNHERYAVLSHGIQDDPIFCYSNVAARNAFQYNEDEFYLLPSRYSAPGGGERTNRAQIMNDVNNNDMWIIPSGIRQRKDGSLFEFRDVILWNVYHPVEGTLVGQSAIYDQDKVVDVPENE